MEYHPDGYSIFSKHSWLVHYVNSMWGTRLLYHKKDVESRKYPIKEKELLQKIIECDYDVSKALKELEDKLEYHMHIEALKEKEKKQNIKETAEKDYFGEVRNKRESIPDSLREEILQKYDYRCAICNAEEGLHIHHRDENPKNNLISNLIVLCGVCHKKVHMKVR
ncbi:MAG: hypothetical protein AABW92_04440 [Nanoarchaeota archaeon]